MLITVEQGFDPARVKRELQARGLWVQRLESDSQIHFLVEPHSANVPREALLGIDGIAAIACAPSGHPLLDRQPSTITVGGIAIGGGAPPVMIAGPCSVESELQIREAAAALAPLGVRFLRGGAFKPRSSPYSFQGHGVRALGWMRRAADAFGMRVVTEAMAPEDVPAVAEHAHLIQIGSRNMQSFALLRAVGAAGRPVLLKRGMSATIEEWLLAGEYLLHHGAPSVILCERGVRGFDTATRNLLDLGAVALCAHVHRLPIVVDPSHGAGRRDLIAPLAKAALAAGASGLLIETHADPGNALSDGPQALSPADLGSLIRSIAREVEATPEEARHADRI
jgi:3-deoxy-7-phosphoheptulonate synthase